MNNVIELFNAAHSGHNITEYVAVKSSTGVVYKKSGEVFIKNYDMTAGLPCLAKKAVFLPSDIPIGTVIVSYGFYSDSSNVMYEESTIYGGNYVMSSSSLEVIAEACIAIEPVGIIVEKQHTRFFRWFFEGEKYNKIHAEVYTDVGVKVVNGSLYSISSAIGFTFNISPICSYTHFDVYMDDEYCFSSYAASVNAAAIMLPANIKEYELETDYAFFTGIEYRMLNEMPMHLYSHTTYSKGLIPIESSDIEKELFSCSNIATNKDVVYALHNGELRTYRFYESVLNQISHGEISKRDIVSCHQTEYGEIFLMSKDGQVGIYKNYTQRGLIAMTQINPEVFKGATSIHISSALYPVMALYQERDKCTVKEFNYTISRGTQQVTYEQVTSRDFKRPQVYTVPNCDYKLIVDKVMNSVSLITGIGLGLKVNENIKNIILRAKNFSFYKRTLFLQNPKLEIYDIVTGEKFEDDNADNNDAYYTMKCDHGKYYARVYYDSSFTLHTFCQMQKKFIQVSDRTTLDSKPIKFVVGGRYLYVLMGNGKHATFKFDKQYFKVVFQENQPTSLRLLLGRIDIKAANVTVRFFNA